MLRNQSFNNQIINNNRGMTLLEIMIVLAILGGLVTILATSVNTRLKKAQVQQARIQIGEVGKQLDMFYTDCGYYPNSLEDLVNEDPECANWGPDPYMKRLPKDPWGVEYQYENTGNSYVLRSLGGDRKEGGDGIGKDISSEDL